MLIALDEHGRFVPGEVASAHIQPAPGTSIDPKSLEVTGIKVDHPLRGAVPEREGLDKVFLPVRAAAAAARDGVEAAARRERSQTATRGAVRASHVSESRAERAKASGADKGNAKNQRAGKNDRRADAKPASKSAAKPSPKDSAGKSAGKGGAKAKAEPKAGGKNKR